MHKELITKFLDDNTPEEKVPSVASLIRFRIKNMVLNNSDEIRTMMNNATSKFKPERFAQAAANKAEIDAADTAEALVRVMRKPLDPLNHELLFTKVMEREAEVIPDVLKRFKRNRTVEFIEIAVCVLAKTKIPVADGIIESFDEIKDPYAQSLALVLLGFRAGEERIPWMIDMYKKLKKSFPREEYHQGAYFGLCEMEDRFYLNKEETNQ